MYKCWVSKFVSTNETLNTYKMRTNPPLWILPIFLIFILFSCSKNEDLQVIENLSSQKTDLYSLAYKKGITNGSLNHLKNLEAEMLEATERDFTYEVISERIGCHNNHLHAACSEECLCSSNSRACLTAAKSMIYK